VRRQVLGLAARAVEQRLNTDHTDGGQTYRNCDCGQTARYAGRREKVFQSSLGPLKLARAYYHCATCGHGFCPRDQQLGLEDTCLSPAVTRMIASVGAMVSFEEGSQLLTELAGLSVDAKQVERAAEALGVEVAEDERQQMQPLGNEPLPSTLYLGIDGTGVPMRASELNGRSGKQPDGSTKTREVKLCTVWSAESRDTEDRPVRDEGSVTYTAAIESAATLDVDEVPSAFTQRVWREATRRAFTQAGCSVVIGDGAPWIWKIAQELFPKAIQIVDRFHVKEHLTTVAKAVYGADTAQTKKWVARRHQELDSGRLPDLLRALRRHVDHSDEARKCFQYIHRNRDRMRYDRFHAQALCTSSGVLEAGCKVAIGTRLKRAGMHWTVRGANAIIALRCCKLSGRFQDFWERRTDARCAA
jgi:Transposase